MPYSKTSFLLSIAVAAAANRAAYRTLLYNAFSREAYQRSGTLARILVFLSQAMMFPAERIRLIFFSFPPEDAGPVFWGTVIVIEGYILHKIITGLRAILAS